MSFAFGLAVFILLVLSGFAFDSRTLQNNLVLRLKSLLGIFTAAVFYFVIVFHLTKLYGTQYHAVEYFLLVDGGIFTVLFWLVQIGLGNVLPLLLIYTPAFRDSRAALVVSCCLIIIGALAQLYVIVIGGQAYPLTIFPGYEVSSSFYDGVVGQYTPSVWEVLLGLGGCSLSILLIFLCSRVLPLLPEPVTDNRAEI